SLFFEQLKRRPSLPVLKYIASHYESFDALCHRITTDHSSIPSFSSLQADLDALRNQRLLFMLALLLPESGATTASEKFAQSQIFDSRLVGRIFSFQAETSCALPYTNEEIEYETTLQPQT